MEIEFNIMPARSGKTSLAVKKFLEDLKNTFVICQQLPYFYSLLDQKLGKPLKVLPNIIDNFKVQPRHFLGYNFDKLVIDDYLILSNKVDIYQIINVYRHKIKKLFIYTSSGRVYDKATLEFVKLWKAVFNYKDVIGLYQEKVKNTTPQLERELKYLYFNFLTDPEVVIKDDFKLNMAESELSRHKAMLGTPNFNLSVLNKWLVDSQEELPKEVEEEKPSFNINKLNIISIWTS